MSSVYDTSMVSRMRSPAARSARPVSVISTTASAMSGTFASVAPYESCTSASMPCLVEVAAGELGVLGVHDARRSGGRSPYCAGESAATASTMLDRPGRRLRVVQLGERDDVGVALLDPVAPGDAEVEQAVGHVLRDLLRAEDAHLVDARVVDACRGSRRRSRATPPRSASSNSCRVGASSEPLGRTRRSISSSPWRES